MATTWSVQFLRKEGAPDTDIDEKTGAIGRPRGPSVATLRRTQVGASTNAHVFLHSHITNGLQDAIKDMQCHYFTI